MKEIESIRTFKDQSTWRLLGLGIITFGVYFAYYMKRQTIKINRIIDDKAKISLGFVNVILALSYVSLLFFILFVFSSEGTPLEKLSDKMGDFTGHIVSIMTIVWGFKARNRINDFYVISKDDREWFHGLWTFFFSPLYFNYKVNKICEALETNGSAQA